MAEQRDELAHRARPAGEVHAERARAVRDDGVAVGAVGRKPDRRDRVAVGQQRRRQRLVVGERPRADRQDASSRVDERERPAGDRGEVDGEARGELVELALREVEHRRLERLRRGGFVLPDRRGRRFDRVRERQELQRHVPVRVVEDRPVDERSAVEPLLSVPVEAHAHRGARQVREDRADPREELAVDDGVDADRAQAFEGRQAVACERGQRAVVDRDDVPGRHDAQHLDDLAVLAEQQDVQGDAGVALLQAREHRLREHEAPHLGEQHDEDVARRNGRRPPREEALGERQQRADRDARPAVDRALRVDLHRAAPGRAAASFGAR